MRIGKRLRCPLYRIARRLVDEAGCTRVRVKIIVRKMVEGTLRNRWSTAFARFKRDSDIERPPGDLAFAARNDASVFILRRADRAFMRMRGEEPDGARRRNGINKRRMERAECFTSWKSPFAPEWKFGQEM